VDRHKHFFFQLISCVVARFLCRSFNPLPSPRHGLPTSPDVHISSPTPFASLWAPTLFLVNAHNYPVVSPASLPKGPSPVIRLHPRFTCFSCDNLHRSLPLLPVLRFLTEFGSVPLPTLLARFSSPCDRFQVPKVPLQPNLKSSTKRDAPPRCLSHPGASLLLPNLF